MKLKIIREVLFGPLSSIISVVAAKSTLPILQNFYIHAAAGVITLTGSDTEVESTTILSNEIKQDGSAAVPAKKLHSILSLLPDGSVLNISTTDNRCIIKTGKSKFTLSILSGDDYPLLNASENYNDYEIPAKSLRILIEQTGFCMAVQDIRYFLNGLLIKTDSDKMTCVAADGHRLALCEAKIDNPDNLSDKVIVPRKGILEILKLIKNTDSTVHMSIGKNHIKVSCSGVSIVSKLIDGTFPDYKTVIPENLERSILIKKEFLKSAIQRVQILSNVQFKGINLEFSTHQIVLSSQNPEGENSQDVIEVNSDISNLKIGFNSSYLLDAISVIKSQKIKLSFKDATSSCLITESDSNDCRLVIMPIRL